jgi:hypothetical protein
VRFVVNRDWTVAQSAADAEEAKEADDSETADGDRDRDRSPAPLRSGETLRCDDARDEGW